MNTNMKQIALVSIASCMLSFAMPVICVEEQKVQQQRSWSKLAKIGAAVTVLAGICVWLYLDIRAQNLLKLATTTSQKQFVEDLKQHATFNADGISRDLISAPYMSAPDSEILKNTTTSLKPLNIDFKTELLFNQIGSKICALGAALGFYGLMKPTRENEQAQDSAVAQA
jgi:hypothetical protein